MKKNLFLWLNLLVGLFFITVVYFPNFAEAEVTGSGTVEDPYTAGTAADLTSALANGKGAPSTIYVQLSNDITYTDSDQFTIYSDVVVNGLKDNITGSYYKMLKTGTSTTTATAGFYLSASGYDVTFENMSFGDETYSYYQTYYGIILGYNYQVDVTIKNVDYFGSLGGQPLCNYNGGTTFTFEGTNNFNVQPGSNSQEFLEGATITFAEDSNTTINHFSTAGATFFYNSTSTSPASGTLITVEANAIVNISTNKRYFTYSNREVNMTVADSAQFIYNCTDYGFNFSNSKATTSTYMIGNNATFAVSGAGKVGSSIGASATFNTTTPAEISFTNTLGTGLFASSSTLNTSSDYLFDYIVNGTTTTTTAGTPSVELQDSTFETNVSKVVYYPQSVISYNAIGEVENSTSGSSVSSHLDVSDIRASQSYTLSSIEYKVFSKSPLADGADPTTTDAQTTISNAVDADYSGTITTNSFSLTDVLAGTYTVFVRGTGTSSSERITQTTKWVPQTVTIDKSTINVTIPIEMTFAIVDNNEFISPETYSSTNQSNFDVTFGIGSVTNVSGITLVNDIKDTNAKNPLYLGLRSVTDSSLELPFVSAVSDANKTFDLSAFGGSTSFNLVGQYGGKISLSSIQDIQYTLTVVIGSS